MKIGEVINEYLKKSDMSAREFAKKAGFSNSYVSDLIRGHRIDRTENIKPSIEACKKIASAMAMSLDELCKLIEDQEVIINSKPIRVPVLGTVRAGIPMDAVENILDYEELSPEMQGEYFGLKIKGDSMSPRICENDVVIVRSQKEVESGDIAIVLVNGNDATCKRVLIGKDGITLVGLNPTFEPIHYSKDQVATLPVQICGKVVECRSKF